MTDPVPRDEWGTRRAQRPPDDLTLPQLLRAHAERSPDRVALVAGSAYGEELDRVSYAQLDELAGCCAAMLADAGVQRGDRVALLFDNAAGLQAMATLYGVHAAGAVNVPINTRFTTVEVVRLLEYCGASVVVGSAPILERLGPALADVDGVKTIVGAGERQVSWAADWRELVSAGVSSAAQSDPEPGDSADWIFTSGTTGAPKCVMTSHRGCVATGAILAETFAVGPDDVLHTPFPFYSSSGCHSSALSALWAGATYVMEPFVDVQAIATRMQAEGTTVFGAVPSVYIYLLESGRLDHVDLRSVRRLFVGGSALLPSLVDELATVFPAAVLVNVYGMTEAGNAGLAIEGRELHEHPASIGRRGMPWTEHRLVDEVGRQVGPGEVGEICLRSPSVMDGYFRDEQATRETIRDDGWLFTGDLARIDDCGYLYIFDRRKDVIIRGGFNISSLEIESVISEHPAVLEAAVVAKPHPQLGEDIRAFVVCARGAEIEAADLARFCGERLADFKVPRDIIFVDELPRNPTGKVQKAVLQAGWPLEDESLRASRQGPPSTEV